MKTLARVNDKGSLRNVLFATDFSTASMQALPYATGIARRFDSKLCIAHVVPPEDYPSGLNSLDEAAQLARREAELKVSTAPPAFRRACHSGRGPPSRRLPLAG